MNSYFAKQPILDLDGETFGYELLYRNTSAKSSYDGIDGDKSTAGIINSVFFGENYNEILHNKKAFLNFTENLILEKAALLLPHDQVVIEVLETVIASEEILDCCRELKESGYIIALDDYIYSEETAALIDYCDIVKIDFRMDRDDIEYTAQRCRENRKILLAEKVETQEECEYAKSLGCTLMQGYYFAQPFIMVGKAYSPMALTFTKLIASLRKENVEMGELAEIISTDPFMTAKLLHLVNAIRSDMSEHIYSVKHALLMLGMNKLKDWIYLLGLQSLSQGGPEERVRVALFRAFFCEAVAEIIYGNPKIAEEMYLMGLMSVVVEQHDEATMNEMMLSKNIKDGIMRIEGVYSDVFGFVLDYEQANWAGVDMFVQKYSLDSNEVSEQYFDSLNRVEELHKMHV